MFGDAPYRHIDSSDEGSSRWIGSRRRARRPSPSPAVDQEQEVRAKLYAKPAATERTVEVLGPVERLADRPAA